MRCSHCKKRTQIEFKCSCEKVYCVTCRLPEVHACPIKPVEKVVLPEAVRAQKVQPI